MNLLILGATGGTGCALVEQALEQGVKWRRPTPTPDWCRTCQAFQKRRNGDLVTIEMGCAANPR